MTEERTFAPHLKCPNRPAKTGNWRMIQPVLNLDKCNVCLLCWIFCPEGAVKKSGKTLEIDFDYCKGCGICARECRRDAIVMIEEG